MKRNVFFLISSLVLSLLVIPLDAAEFNAENVVIVQENENRYVQDASMHLQKHLQLTAGRPLSPGMAPYKFIIKDVNMGNKAKC